MTFRKLITYISTLTAVLLFTGCAGMGGGPVSVSLSGSQEVPPVNTSASGTGTISVAEDKTMTAKITTQGLNDAFAAHIHEGAAGANGPVVVPMMEKTGNNEWSAKPGTKLTDAQYEAYKAGRLYFNVHTKQNKGGEIRGQIRPAGSTGGGGGGGGGMSGSTY